ncbi:MULTISPECIES: MBL fold metallo-hydrolase [Thermodesulfovibrio]|uniref:Metallo-beta-lactamase family protein n=1 Tax=Thermodesulfovibrio yellowstonii (strain ATCC 51303 / DSM 11347 / YP87) TaxID=289376 RepID=B5YL18_THEYD|nr:MULTISPECIES: MBL fold metallo-hydrolase [Thermodesulfovibrio]ACI20876.1 metallo-beta-lactamase family protein [Thermodesulfovibrio yellowstonii DSM 11347]MDI6864128.1 MBL fold metallo-hydrolase [Thermodesulfovibrio yellowstonii]
MKIKKFEVGPLFVNCYIIYDERTKEAVVIDPGDEPDLILDFIKEENLNLKYILCTHGHFDHIGSVKELRDETGAKVVLHEKDIEIYRNSPQIAMQFFGIEIEPQPEPDILIKNGEILNTGNIQLTVIHTSGHSPGSVCFYTDGYIFTGDTLFAGSVGRTDIIGGSMNELLNSLKKIASLPDETIVFPGHGPKTKIGIEKKTNPFYHEVI